MEIEFGYCHCGCGEKTSIPTKSCANRGIVKGQPRRFIPGHNSRIGNRMEAHWNWQGGRFFDSSGYVLLRIPDHPNASKRGVVKEHVFIASQALGKPLPIRVEVHHINGIRDDNRNENLLICENHAYHGSLHEREKARIACGHAKWRQCKLCHQWDDPSNLSISGGSAYHVKCMTLNTREKRKEKCYGERIDSKISTIANP